MKDNVSKLTDLLQELFQLDQADLDFGIYRIMNARRDEINRFLGQDLLPQVHEAFSEYKSADKALLKQELDKAIEQAKALEIDPDTAPKVKELREKYETSSVDVGGLENEVYDHLYNFFKRYYDEGDFISLRRYKEGVYAIPYEGEEVKLYWANHDQYYIKTTENFRDYAFKTTDGSHVHFKIVEADTEKDNIKSTNGKDRRFFLIEENPVAEENGELVIRFEYQPDEQKRKQDQLNVETARRVIELLKAEGLESWEPKLTAKWKRVDDTVTDKAILEKHLSDYTRRNTFDYFIHKNLGEFLRRELDFYIKNEVMRLDDVESESAPRVEQYLSKIKVIRRIAHKIIDFLVQIEDFQKKLWLKKKFVVETNYCITLDRIPEDFYPEIASNEDQRKEWVRLFAIDEIKGDMVTPAYTAPLEIDFLKENPHLVLDTKYFNGDFKARLLSSIENIDSECEGLLVCSENFQALNLLEERYRERINCIYIDPPYNTDASPIMYKNDYRRSSWVCLLDSRLRESLPFLAKNGILVATVDDFQQKELHLLMIDIFGKSNILGVVAIRNNPSGRPSQTGFLISHEYAIFAAASNLSAIARLGRTERQNKRYRHRDKKGSYMWELLRKRGSDSERKDSPKLYYPFFVDPTSESIRVPLMEWDEHNKNWILKEKPKEAEVEVYPIDENGIERRWRWGVETANSNFAELKAETNGVESFTIYYRYRPPLGTLPTTNWIDSKYSATEHGTGLLKRYFQDYDPFSFPKSVYAVEDCIRISGLNEPFSTCLDYFAGSGTTGHAVLNLNREDGGKRKYVLVEMGYHFDTVLMPRIKKVVYASDKDWEGGKPTSHNNGISHMFKYLRLESYEDALANIQLIRKDAQKELLESSASFRESYMLKYMLETESRGSPSLLNIDRFEDPSSYQLLVGTGSVGETRAVNTDLVETFNWLLGLRVQRMKFVQGYRTVEGTDPKGERILIIWRKIRDLADTDLDKITEARKKSNDDLDSFFQEQQYNKAGNHFDIIYVNGDNNLLNLPVIPDGGEPTYRVRLIEEEFKRLMFDVKDI